MRPKIILEGISKSYGNLKVLQNFSATFEQSKTYVIFGPSGCGKTTLLRIIAGLSNADSGMIHGLENWLIAYMFQEERLLPWATVADNIRLVLTGTDTEVNDVIKRVLELVDLIDFGDYYPAKLSGGMRRRVSLARVLAYLECKGDRLVGQMLILDEPFKELDLEMKQQLIEYIMTSRKPTQITLLVTHDKYEAEAMANEIISMNHAYNISREIHM